MQVQDLARLEGPTIDLRLIEPDDAEYVHSLRTDPDYNRHLSSVTGTIEDQKQWILAYKKRAAELRELYYVVERKDAVRCGLVRLYDIGPDEFTWGSWILDANKPPKAAIESAILSFGVGFEYLGLERALVDVRQDNAKAIAIYERLGMTELRRDVQDIYFAFSSQRYREERNRYFSSLVGSK